MLMTLLSREGLMSSFFCNKSTNHCSITPLPSASSSHCARSCGLSNSLRSRITRSATRSEFMISTCVAMKLGIAAVGFIIAVTGSGLASITTLDVPV